MKTKVVNFYAGPGTGKSTSASALFAELKYRNVDCELVTEVAKEAAWAGYPEQFFKAQDMIHGLQHKRIFDVSESGVSIIITDSPLLLGIAYMPEDYPQPSLANQIREAYCRYENLDIFLRRNKPYNPKGRYQNEQQAKKKDEEILSMLNEELYGNFDILEFGRGNVDTVISIMTDRGWLTSHERVQTV